eukprot:COSAG02_NODE_12722_length_1503_cov_1.712963_1_plen_67_part_00
MLPDHEKRVSVKLLVRMWHNAIIKLASSACANTFMDFDTRHDRSIDEIQTDLQLSCSLAPVRLVNE